MPLGSKISVCGSFASGTGILYSVTAPVFGSSLPIKAPVFPVYQMFPSRSSTRPCGPEWGVLRGNSLNRPVFGSSRPSTLFIWPVYQSDPSAVARGSCGRDPGVGTGHSLMEIFADPGITTAAGFPVSGKFAAALRSPSGASPPEPVARAKPALLALGPRHGEERAHDVPQLIAREAERDRVGRAREHDELTIGIRQATVKLEEVFLGRDT